MSEKNVSSTNVGGDIKPLAVITGVSAIAIGVVGFITAGYRMGTSQSRAILRDRERRDRQEMRGWKLYYREKNKHK